MTTQAALTTLRTTAQQDYEVILSDQVSTRRRFVTRDLAEGHRQQVKKIARLDGRIRVLTQIVELREGDHIGEFVLFMHDPDWQARPGLEEKMDAEMMTIIAGLGEGFLPRILKAV